MTFLTREAKTDPDVKIIESGLQKANMWTHQTS